MQDSDSDSESAESKFQNKVLIWIRTNPKYQNKIRIRPNPKFWIR